MFNKSFNINGRKIGDGCKPFIIAEMSANHAQNIENAKQIIELAQISGADAVKIQTYTADTLTLNCKKKHFEAKGAWRGTYLYDLYSSAYMPWVWTKELQLFAKDHGIILFSSPFDNSAVDFLETLEMPAYKIASPEIIDLQLIERVAMTGKPVIISTGGATLAQIYEAVEVLKDNSIRDLAILKCTSEYPAPANEMNLKTIADLKSRFNCVVGLSDHSLGSSIPIASIAFGAQIIEKHFIVDKKNKTADSFFSSTPDEMKEIVHGTNQVWQAKGEINYPKKPNLQRSLIAIEDIKKGDTLQINKNFRSLRPGGGIEPKFCSKVNLKQAVKDIEFGELLSWDMIEGEGD